MPPIAQAQGEVNNIYAPALNQIQGQIPAVQNLYNSLLTGLQGQAQNQISNVAQSAAQRGVSSYGVNQGAQDTLTQALLFNQGQLGAQQAQQVAGLQGELGKARVSKGQATYDLANSLQAQNLESQSNQIKMTDMQRQAQLQQQKNQQSYNVAQASYATRQARAAAAATQDLTTVGEGTIARQLRIGLGDVKGKDGHVSPENLAKAYSIWQQAGLEPAKFWSNFQGLWNPKQKNYGDQFHYFLTR
jgi:hypothetical protein